ncbi:BCCT family transporter [Actinacidiphila alni]|uniref:BCCT family transporter n=1 Tax=Actinacidiphila alni TaxID=380248 RepID=UPI003F50587C
MGRLRPRVAGLGLHHRAELGSTASANRCSTTSRRRPPGWTRGPARTALECSFFHWTLHPWAIRGIAGPALAYAGFRKGRGNRLSAVFVPLIGERRAAGWPGRAIDLLAVFATVFGTATSLGLGALLVAEGFHITAHIEPAKGVQLVIIGALSAAFVASARPARRGQ